MVKKNRRKHISAEKVPMSKLTPDDADVVLVDTETKDKTTASKKILRWEIDTEDVDPRAAALYVWHGLFGRGDPGPDDACVFTVIDTTTGEKTTIDLSEQP